MWVLVLVLVCAGVCGCVWCYEIPSVVGSDESIRSISMPSRSISFPLSLPVKYLVFVYKYVWFFLAHLFM